MLPCAYKSLLGIDCPFCGAQRSFLLLLKGNLVDSLLMYPPLLPVFFCALLFSIHLVNKKITSGRKHQAFFNDRAWNNNDKLWCKTGYNAYLVDK